jgi:hypothetical protein
MGNVIRYKAEVNCLRVGVEKGNFIDKAVGGTLAPRPSPLRNEKMLRPLRSTVYSTSERASGAHSVPTTYRRKRELMGVWMLAALKVVRTFVSVALLVWTRRRLCHYDECGLTH